MEAARKRSSPARVVPVFLFTLISVLAPVINYGFRVGYLYIDHEVKLPGFAQGVFYLMIANALFAIFYLARSFSQRPRRRGANIALTVLFALSSLLSVFFQLMNYISSNIARFSPAAYYIPRILPWVLALLGVPALLLVYPRIPWSKRARGAVSVALSAVFVLCMVLPALHLTPLNFSSDPFVLDTGTGYYSVVFSTNEQSQGYVTYTYDGVERIVYSADNGARRVGRIHAALIPREELENNSYTIHATRVRDRLAYQSKLHYGKTIDSAAYAFRGDRTVREPKILSLSDWHDQVGEAAKAAALFEQPDLVFLAGDYADFYVSEQDVIRFFLRGAAAVTGGEIPAVFARGNHEVRGDFDIQALWRMLGLPGFYYEVERGNYIITVLDSGEGSEYEGDWWEHDGGYDMIPYLAEELSWFEQREPAPEGKYRIVLTHDADFANDKPEDLEKRNRTAYYDERVSNMPAALASGETMNERYNAALDALGVRLVVSGHSHRFDVRQTDFADRGVTKIMDGGRGTLEGTGRSSALDITHFPKATFACIQLAFQGDTIAVDCRSTDPSKQAESMTVKKFPLPVVDADNESA